MKTFTALVALTVGTLAVGCAAVPGTVSGALPDSAVSLQQEFEKRTAALDVRSKSTPRQRLNVLQELLDQRGEDRLNREFADLIARPLPSANRAFDDLLAQALVERFLKATNSSSLQRLLQATCPDYVAAIPLEFVLGNSKMPDAVLLLTRAYSEAQTDKARQESLRCLDRAFPLLRQPGQADIAFVSACEQWWEANRSRCVLNSEYPHLPARPAPPPGRVTPPTKSGLFLIND